MLIGICGPEGAGKSMAAKLLKVATGGELHPFAAPLKRMIEALGVDPRHLYGTPAEKEQLLPVFGGRSARHAMQTLGTEWGRKCIEPDFWVRAWLNTLPNARVVIADDVRFTNEAETILRKGGVVIRVMRSHNDLLRQARHASEDFAAVPFSFQVVNDQCPTILRNRLVEGLGQRAPAALVAAE